MPMRSVIPLRSRFVCFCNDLEEPLRWRDASDVLCATRQSRQTVSRAERRSTASRSVTAEKYVCSRARECGDGASHKRRQARWVQRFWMGTIGWMETIGRAAAKTWRKTIKQNRCVIRASG